MKTKLFRGLILSSLAMGFAVVNSARANPEGAVVVGGSATVSGAGTGNTVINQTSDRAIINWQDFSIGLGEITRFIQPGSDAAVLNRVLSGNPSQLLGTLQANGQVYLINPNGIVVGPSGVINASSFVGSTLNVSDNQFMSGGNLDFLGSTMAGVENLGSINALGGNIFLFGHTVKNSGTIKADGVVGLAAGTKIELRQSGNERIGVLLGDAATQSAVGVDNQGLIQATSAEIQAAGGNIYAVAINNGGTIRAQPTLTMEGGKLVLKSVGGTVVNTGTLDASNPNGKGGDIQILGGKVGLTGNGVVDASGKTGGGSILVGGDYQGKNADVANASRTYVGSGVVLKADALQTGNGGKVIVWSDEITRFYGSISAKGGAQGGNGGFAEVSGKTYLVFDGDANLSALNGNFGSLLLDPRDLTIVSGVSGGQAQDALVTATGILFANPNTATDVTITTGKIESLASSGDITLQANQDLFINGALTLNNQGNGRTTTFQAGRNLSINAAVTTGGGSLVFTASDAGGLNDAAATLTIGAPVSTGLGGAITFNNDGSGGIKLGSTVNANLGTVNFNNPTVLTADSSVTGLNVNFNSTVDGAFGLTLTGTAGAKFNASVGNTTPLSSITATVPVLDSFGAVIKTSGLQTYNGVVRLNATTAFTASTVDFKESVTGVGAPGLTINGNVNFGDGIDNPTPDGVAGLSSIHVTGTTLMNNSGISTTGDQTYDSTVTLTADTTLAGANITLQGVTGNAHSLTVNGSAVTTFAGTLSGLSSLTTDASGTTTLGISSITTTGDQTFNDPVTLTGNTTLTSSASGAITFASTVNGAFTLAVNTSGATTFGGVVGGGTALTSLTTDATGATAINGGTVTTTGAQTYNDDVTLGAATTLVSTGAGNINLAAKVDGAQTLAVNTTGTTTFGGAVGSTTPLTSVTTDAGGSTAINGGAITTTGVQLFNDAVTVSGATTLASTGSGNIRFVSTLNGTADLTLNTGGTTRFDATVGGVTPLTSITTDAAGTTRVAANITTTGAQTYNDAINLQAGSIFASTSSGNITFGSTIDGGNTLTVNTAGTTAFNGQVGSGTSLTSVTTDAAGGTTINTTLIKTTGAQTYNDPVTLAVSTLLNSTGAGNVAFVSTLDGAFGLTVNTGGTTSFGGIVGGTAPLASITTNPAGTTSINTTAITTTGTQDYQDDVTLGVNTVLTSTGSGAIGFAKTLNGAFSLTANTAGQTTFTGVVGGGTALTSITTDSAGGTVLNTTAVTTTGDQTYNDQVIISKNVVVASTGSGAISFNNTIDGGKTLDVNTAGVTTFGGVIGGNTALTSVATDAAGSTALNAGTVTTTGAQTYDDAVTLGAATTLNSTGAGQLRFGSTVNGAQTLVLNTGGTTRFNGVVGGTTALTSVTTDAGGTTILNGSSVTTTGNQTYNDAVTLNNNQTLTSTGSGDIKFTTTVDGAKTLAVNTAGVTTFGGAVGTGTALTSVTTDSAGSTQINGGAVTTTGSQDYQDAVTLGAATTLTSTGNNAIRFRSTLDGGNTLSIVTGGNTRFDAAVGGTIALTSVTTDAGGATLINGGSVRTTGSQTYNDNVTIGANTTLSSTGAGNITLGGTTDGAFDLTVSTAGTATFTGTVGGTTPLVNLDIQADGISFNAITTTTSVTLRSFTAGKSLGVEDAGQNINFTDAKLDGITTPLLTIGDTANTGGIKIATDAAVSQNKNLVFTTSTTIGLNGALSTTSGGTVTMNNGGLLTIAAAGDMNLDGAFTQAGAGLVSTAGDITTTDDLVSFATGVTLTGNVIISTGAGNVTFNSTVDGGFDLTLNGTGNNTFKAAVGNTAPLNSLTTDAGGTTKINGGLVKTTGNQSYGDAVTIGQVDAVVTSTGAGAITFSSTLDGSKNFTANTGGATTFTGAVGGNTALDSVTTDATGTTVINGGSVKTSGAQTYNDAVTIGANTTFRSTGSGDIKFVTTLDGGFDATINTSGITTFGGAVGATTALTSVTTDAGGSLVISGGSVKTTGNQLYNDPASLGADAVLTSTGAGNIRFFSTVDGAFALTANTGGTTRFDGQVGGTTPLASVTTDATGTTAINGGVVNTTTFQTYGDNVTLGADATLTSSASGNITFNGKVNGTFALVVNTTGATIFNGTVGNNNALVSVTTDAPGSTQINGGSVDTTTFQTYNDTVTIGANTILTSTGSGDVTFVTTVDGGFDLTVNTAGITKFGGAVGNGTALNSVTTDAAGSTQINGGIVTTVNRQTYNDPVTLGADATLTSTTDKRILFGSTVDDDGTAGNANLTVKTGGQTVFTGAVGGIAELTSLTTDAGGETHFIGQIVNSNGDQTFGDAVIVEDNTTFTSSNSGHIWFKSTLDGDAANDANANVTVNTQGLTTFQGRVGMASFATGPTITTLTTDAGGTTRINSTVSVATSGAFNNLNDATVYTSGNQTFNDDVVLSPIDGGDVLLRSETGTISFAQRIDGTTFNLQGLKLIANNSSVNQSLIGNQTQLQFFDSSLTPGGGFQNITLTQNTEIVAGNVIFGTVTAGTFELTVTANDITFAAGANSVTGTSDVTLRPIDPTSTIGIGGGAGTFNLDDADIAALADGFHSLTIGRFNSSGLITVGAVTFRDPVRIQSPEGSILVEGLVQSTASVAQGLAAADVFKTDINPAGTRVNSDTITASGKNSYGLVNGVPAPANGAGVLIVGLGNTTTLQANIQTAGTAIFINDSVQLDTDASLNTTAGGNVAGNDITITGAINSIAGDNFGLTLRGGTGGNIDIQNTVGNAQALSDILIPSARNVDFDNTVNVTGAITFTSANDIIFRNTVTAGGAITVTAANNVNFENTVAAGSVSQAAGTGTTLFRDNVTTTTASGVNITSSAITLDGLTIDSTTGNGTVRFNGPVTLSTADVTVTTGTGAITFENTINGGVNLTLTGSGLTTLNGQVGGAAELTSFTVDGGGNTLINSAGVATSGNQTYNDNVQLGVASVTVASSGSGAISFNGTVTGPAALTANTAGTTTFAGTVGVGSPLQSVTTDAAGTTAINGGIVTTTGTQTYNDNVTLGANTTLTGSSVTFGGTVDATTAGVESLTITGNAVFGDSAGDFVGATTALEFVTVSGTTTFNAGNASDTVTTAGLQTYTGAVTLGADTTLTSTGAGNITFSSTVNGAFNLAVNTAGNTTFSGAVTTTSVTTDAGGTTLINGGTVATTAAQTYNDAVVLGANTTLTATTVTFNGTVDAAAAGAQSLAITGNAIFGDAAGDFVGNTAALSSLSVSGTTALNAGNASTTVTTTGDQTYTGAVTLGANTTLAGNDITFSSTLDSAAATLQDLTVNTSGGGTTLFNGVIGGTDRLAHLVTNADGQTQINAGTINLNGNSAIFNDPVVLLANLQINEAGAGTVTFNSTVNGTFSLNVDTAAGTTIFNGAVGNLSPLTTVTTDADGTTQINGGLVTTTGAQTYNDAVTLGADTTLTGTTITFNSTLNDAAAGTQSLAIVGNAIFGDAAGDFVGNTAALEFLTVSGTTTFNAGNASATVTTTGLQTYSGAVTLGGNTTLTSTGAGNITLGNTVNGAFTLAVNTAGTTIFNGVVGGTAQLVSVTTDAAGTTQLNGGAVTTTTTQTYLDPVILGNDNILTGTLVTFGGTVNGTVAGDQSLTVTGNAAFGNGAGDFVGNTVALEFVTVTGTTIFNAGNAGNNTVSTTLGQTYNGAVTLGADTTLSTTTGTVQFNNTVNGTTSGTESLAITGNVVFGNGAGDFVGNTVALEFLTVSGTTTFNAGITGANTVRTTGLQTYTGAVTLGADTTLASTGAGNITFSSAVNGGFNLVVNTAGITTFTGVVGGVTPLLNITTDAAGSTAINGGLVITTADQTYNDPVRLGVDTVINGNDISFNSTLNSSAATLRSLIVNSTGGGTTLFNGVVGGVDRLSHLETNADGQTTINAGTINLNGASALFNDPVVLLSATTINEAGVGAVTFNNTVNGAFALVVNSTGGGATIFNGIVGGTTPLASVTTDAAGTTQINGGAVTTTGFQTYNDPVTIGANTILNSTAAGNITFAQTLNGPFTLAVNTAGVTTFGGVVGGITPLNSITTDAPGSTSINGGAVTTFATQTYNDPVNLGATTLITSTGAAAAGNVTFNSTLNGAFALTVNTAGATTFNGAVGGGAALVSLTTDAPGTVAINGGAVTTTTFQTYNDPVTIGANTTLTSTGAGNITFAQTLNGAFSLIANTAGQTIFNGVVGGAAPLTSVTTDAAGGTQVNGTAVTTTGFQLYNDPVTVGANTLFTSTAAGSITFANTLNDDAVAGAADVTVNTAGITTFGGAVGGIAPLTSLTTDAPGSVQINGGLVTTTGNQTYNDTATLGANTTLNSLLAGNITFNQTLDDDGTVAPSNLIVNTAGITTFTGVVGGIAPLTSITTDFGGTAGDITAINGGAVTTTGFQLYNDNVTLGQDTVLTSTTVGDITIGMPNPPVPWGVTTLTGTVPGVDLIVNALGGNVQINAAVSAVDTINGQAVATFIGANPGNTGINLYYSLPSAPFVFIFSQPLGAFNLNNKIYSVEEIFGRDAARLFPYPGDAMPIRSDISVLLTTNRVEKLIGTLPNDKILTSYDLAALDEARKNR